MELVKTYIHFASATIYNTREHKDIKKTILQHGPKYKVYFCVTSITMFKFLVYILSQSIYLLVKKYINLMNLFTIYIVISGSYIKMC